jgi:hypothetical protein
MQTAPANFRRRNAAVSARLYYGLRIFLHKRRWLLRFSQVARAYVIYGPFRNVMLRHQRSSCVNQPIAVDRSVVFPAAPDMETIVERINSTGFAHLGEIRQESVQEILDYCAEHRQARYWNPHQQCAAVDVIARNALLVDVARRYLGAEPAIRLTGLKWTLPRPDELALRPPTYKQPIQYDAHAFHYDILDWTSLTLFVYLTDVDQDCCPHAFVEGTHTRKTLREIGRITIDDSIVTRKYKDAVRVILGKKGTAFIEDTSGIHKMSTGRKNRLILSIDYVLNRRPFHER